MKKNSREVVMTVINWEGPFSFRELISPKRKEEYKGKRGVYLWVEPTTKGEKKYRTSYVGKAAGAPCLWERQFQHFKLFRGGLYTIPKEHFDGVRSWRAVAEKEIFDTHFDSTRFNEIIEVSFRYLKTIKIYIAPLGSAISNDKLKLIESNLIYALQPIDERTRGKKHPPKGRELLIYNTGAKWWQKDGYGNYLKEKNRTLESTPQGVRVTWSDTRVISFHSL